MLLILRGRIAYNSPETSFKGDLRQLSPVDRAQAPCPSLDSNPAWILILSPASQAHGIRLEIVTPLKLVSSSEK